MITIRFSIIIVNYKTLDWTRQCLESIRANSQGEPYEIIVIDNDSRDESLTYLKSQADIRLIERTTGLHYDSRDHGEALDLGLRYAQGDYVVVLDSDVLILKKGWLSALTKLLAQENAVLVGPCFYRNFIHACFLMVERNLITKYQLSFAPQSHFHRYYDTAEYITEALLRHGHRIVSLDVWTGDYANTKCLQLIDGTNLARWVKEWWSLVARYGAFVGGIAYHAFYGTRILNAETDRFASVLASRKFDLPAIQATGNSLETSYSLLTDSRSPLKRIKDNAMFTLNAGNWLARRTFVRTRDWIRARV